MPPCNLKSWIEFCSSISHNLRSMYWLASTGQKLFLRQQSTAANFFIKNFMIQTFCLVLKRERCDGFRKINNLVISDIWILGRKTKCLNHKTVPIWDFCTSTVLSFQIHMPCVKYYDKERIGENMRDFSI